MQMVVGLKYKWGTTFEHILLNNYMKKININVFPLIGRPYLYTPWVAYHIRVHIRVLPYTGNTGTATYGY